VSGEEDREPEIHKSTIERLVYMANQIADFFESQGDADKAAAGTADHLKSFWDPAMRRKIFTHLDQGGAGLKPVALNAVRKLRDAAPGTIRQDVAAAGLRSGREPGNDAG
jgi:formate dehydrogenase subunit delta